MPFFAAGLAGIEEAGGAAGVAAGLELIEVIGPRVGEAAPVFLRGKWKDDDEAKEPDQFREG